MTSLNSLRHSANTMPSKRDYIHPDWPAPMSVKTLVSTRQGGVSEGPYASFNLGLNSGDDARHVLANRRVLADDLPAPPLWLQQVHGAKLVYAPDVGDGVEADAVWTDQRAQPIAILSADCLPLLLCGRGGQWVAAIHGGWRGLAAGIIQKTVAALPDRPEHMLAWLGPAISAHHYAIDEDVYRSFMQQETALSAAFNVSNERLYADLYAIARMQLNLIGVDSVSGGGFCTFASPERFYSYRRDRQTGRQAACIWLEE